MNTPRWYMLNKMGMATLCASKADAEKEAADAQRLWPHMGPHRAVQLVEVASVAASAGSETVAEVMFADGKKYIQYTMPKELLPVGTKLYTHHSPPEGMVGGWIALPGAPAQPVVPVVPAGYALVPVEPTPEMLSVMWVNKNSSLSEAYNSLSEAYSAMLAASPQPVVVREPLTDEQIEALPLWKRFVGLWPETRREIVRIIESAHGIGIKGGQHGL